MKQTILKKAETVEMDVYTARVEFDEGMHMLEVMLPKAKNEQEREFVLMTMKNIQDIQELTEKHELDLL